MATADISAGDLAAVERCKKVVRTDPRRAGQCDHRQSSVIEQYSCHFSRASTAGRRARIGQDLLVSSLAEATHLSFKRISSPGPHAQRRDRHRVIQEDLKSGGAGVQFLPGLVRQMILADEINRTPPKTQAAMLEGCKSGGQRRRQDAQASRAFFVLATQTLGAEAPTRCPRPSWTVPPVHQSRLPTGPEEWEIGRKVTTGKLGKISPLLSDQDIIARKSWCSVCR